MGRHSQLCQFVEEDPPEIVGCLCNSLNTISHVHKGDLLARLIKEDKGDPGKNIYGEEILPRTVKTEKLSYGKNISINEDGTEIYSEVTGHVNKFDDKVFVSDVFAVLEPPIVTALT